MTAISGTFQFFFCSRLLTEMPNPAVPTRDITNNHRRGYKTEPYLEERTENWCKCRARFITAAVRRARRTAKQGGQDYLLLTTRHPRDELPFIVGLMPFSLCAFEQLIDRFRNRWSEKSHLPYVSDKRLKLASFYDAFPLAEWMQREQVHTIPGGQGGRIRVPENLLQDVIKHFSSKSDQTAAFLANVNFLEKTLKKSEPKEWSTYKNRLPAGGKCFAKRQPLSRIAGCGQ
jgi:hypothetical protein